MCGHQMPYADTHGSSSLLFAAAIDRSVFKHFIKLRVVILVWRLVDRKQNMHALLI